MLFSTKEPYLRNDVIRCIHLINKIKEHRHNKIKARQIIKFKCSVNKNSGYMHNFTRHDSSGILTIGADTFLCVDIPKKPIHPNQQYLHTVYNHSSRIHYQQFNTLQHHQTKVGH